MEMMDFIGFTYNGKHSFYDLGIYRTIDGSRYNESITPAMTDKTADVPGSDGQYYFGTTFKNRSITINYAFDSLTEDKLALIKQTFSGDGIHELVFDETPYKAWSAKVTGTAQMKHICFEEDGERVYKGEGSLTFTCYYPYAHTPSKLWQYEGRNVVYKEKDGRNINSYDKKIYINLDEWKNASGLTNETKKIKGDVPTTTTLSATFKDLDSSEIEEPTTVQRICKKLLINNKEIVLKTETQISEGQIIKLNTKTGILSLVEGNNIQILPYSGEGLLTFTPNEEIVFRLEGENLNNYTTSIECIYLYR